MILRPARSVHKCPAARTHCIRRRSTVLAVAACMLVVLPARAQSDVDEGIRARITTAGAAIDDGLYRIAERELKKALREAASENGDPLLASEAVALLARVLLETDRTDKLGKLLNERRRWLKSAAPGTAAFWKALAEYKFGDVEKSLKIVRGFEEDYPDSAYRPRVLRLTAWCHLDGGRTNDAVLAFAEFDLAYEESPAYTQNLLEWGQTLIALGDFAEASRVLSRLVERGTDAGLVAIGRLWLARVLIERDQLSNAAGELEHLTDSSVVDPNLVAQSWFALADVHESMNATNDAVAALERGLVKANRADLAVTGRRRLGLLYLSAGNVSNGVATLKEYVTESPDDPDAGNTQLILASALLENDEPASALDEFQHFLETFTNASGIALAHKGRGWALYDLVRFPEAATAFNKCYQSTTSETEQAECLFKEGDAYFENKQFGRSAARYDTLILDHPDSVLRPRALFQLAESYARLEAYDDAEETFMKLADAQDDDDMAAEALLRSAQLKEERGMLDGAKDRYTKLMQSEAHSEFYAEATMGRGRVLDQLFRFDEAIKDFKSILARFEGSEHVEEAKFRIAFCMYWLGRDDEAVAMSEAFLNEYTNSPYAARLHFWLGKHAYNEQDYAAAETRFAHFTNAYPQHAEVEKAVLWMGKSAVAQKNYRKANEYFGDLVKMNPEGPNVPEALYEQAGLQFKLAKYPEAILVFNEIVTKYPDFNRLSETRIRIGNCQFQLGATDTNRYELAMPAYQAAANHPDADMDIVLQGEYKIGLCLEKLEQYEDAMQRYYSKVMIPFRREIEKGVRPTEAARTWFLRATRNAADIRADQQEWRKAVNILERALGVGLADEDDAIRERISSIRSNYWWSFY